MGIGHILHTVTLITNLVIIRTGKEDNPPNFIRLVLLKRESFKLYRLKWYSAVLRIQRDSLIWRLPVILPDQVIAG